MNPVLVDGVLWVPRRAERPGIIGDYMAPLEQSDPEYDEWMEMAVQAEPGVSWAGLEEALVAAAWDESKHPRHPAGVETGGQFSSKITVEIGQVVMEGEGADAKVYHAGARASELPGEIMAWKEDEPREYAKKAYFAAKEPDNHLIVVRRDGELIGVGQFTYMGPDTDLAGGYFGAVKGGGMPLFNASLEEAEKRGVGASWDAGNERAKKLYDKLEIPHPFEPTQEEYDEADHELYPDYDDYYDAWDEEFGYSYRLDPEQVRLLSKDMFALARGENRTAALEAMVAAGWVEADHPRDPGGEGGGQFVEKETTGADELLRLTMVDENGEGINSVWSPTGGYAEPGGAPKGDWILKPPEEWRSFDPDEPHVYADYWPASQRQWPEGEEIVNDTSPPNPRVAGVSTFMKRWIQGRTRNSFPWWREIRASYADQMGLEGPAEPSSYGEHTGRPPMQHEADEQARVFIDAMEVAKPEQPALWRGLGTLDKPGTSSDWTSTVAGAKVGDTLRMLPASWSRSMTNARSYAHGDGGVMLYALPGSRGLADKARLLSDEEVVTAGDFEVVASEEVEIPYRAFPHGVQRRKLRVVTVRQRDHVPDGLTAAIWDESKHPRDPGGEGGGQFVETETGSLAMGLGTESQLEFIEGRYHPSEEGKIAAVQRLREFLDGADLQMRVPEDVMMEIFVDGKIMNQHEHGEGSRGMPRDVKSEASMLGLPIESTSADLPKYAYLGPDTGSVNMYGPIKLHFKEEVKARSTFTVGDSLMVNALPSKISDPRWQSAYSEAYAGGDPAEVDWNEALLNGDLEYMEAQVYGRLTPDDIDFVEVLDEDYWEDEDPMTGMPMVGNIGQMGAVMDELQKRKIPWSTYIPAGDFSGEWA